MGKIDFSKPNWQQSLQTKRLDRLRHVMSSQNVPALLILDPVNILYATGARNMSIFSMRVPARYLLVTVEGPTVLFEFLGCEHLAENLSTIDLIFPAHGLCHVSSGGNPADAARKMTQDVVEVLQGHKISIDQLAIDRFPLPAIDALRNQGFDLIDADPIFSSARKTKLPEEVEVLRESMRRCIDATRLMSEKILPGKTEAEVWSEFHQPFISTEGAYVTTRLFQSGSNTFPYFQEAGNRVIEKGDLICFDTDAVGFSGYCTDFSRTYLCGDGSATVKQKELYATAKEQLLWNSELLKPGASFEEIAEAAWKIPTKHQDSRYYCIGHGLGMSGEYPNISHKKPNEKYLISGELEPGMIICIESYIGSKEQVEGIKLEDQFLITETGSENMSLGAEFDYRLES